MDSVDEQDLTSTDHFLGERCLAVVENVTVDRWGKTVWGDVFLTDTDLVFVGYLDYEKPPAKKPRTSDDEPGRKYTVGGLLVGGLPGAIVGSAIDASMGGVANDYRRDIGLWKNETKAEKEVKRLRAMDFGLSPSQRITGRHYVQIPRSGVKDVKRLSDGSVSITYSGGRLEVGRTSSSPMLSRAVAAAIARPSRPPKSCRQRHGANVGIGLEGFVGGLLGDSTRTPLAPGDQRRATSDQEYVARLGSRLLGMRDGQLGAALGVLHAEYPIIWESTSKWIKGRRKSCRNWCVLLAPVCGALVVLVPVLWTSDPVLDLYVGLFAFCGTGYLVLELQGLTRARRAVRAVEQVAPCGDNQIARHHR